MPLIVYRAAALTSLSDSIRYITFLFSERRIAKSMVSKFLPDIYLLHFLIFIARWLKVAIGSLLKHPHVIWHSLFLLNLSALFCKCRKKSLSGN